MSHLKIFRFVLSVVKGNRYTEVSSSAITFNAFPVSIRGFKTKWKNYLFYLFSFILLFFKRCGRQLSCFRRCTTHPTCPADESEFMVVVDLTRFSLFSTWQGFFWPDKVFFFFAPDKVFSFFPPDKVFFHLTRFFFDLTRFFLFCTWQGFFFFAPHTSHFTGIRFFRDEQEVVISMGGLVEERKVQRWFGPFENSIKENNKKKCKLYYDFSFRTLKWQMVIMKKRK